jgi:hypothetical protein
LYNKNWLHISDLAYYNLREMNCYHSGDITSAPEGACEFIDIGINTLLKKGIKYVVMSVICYTGQHFVDMPECFAGWMMRRQPNSGEIFEPRTVIDKVDLTANLMICLPIIIDLENRKVFWSDIGLKGRGALYNNAAGNQSNMERIGKAFVNMKKASLYDLFMMHVEARGTDVDMRQEADYVFDLYEGNMNAFDINKILSEFLG